MDNPSFDIAPVTRAQVDNLLAQLTANGSTVKPGSTPDSWDIKGHKFFIEVEADARYDESLQILAVEVVHGPAGRVEAELRKQLGLPS
jgi:hypothetical protein